MLTGVSMDHQPQLEPLSVPHNLSGEVKFLRSIKVKKN